MTGRVPLALGGGMRTAASFPFEMKRRMVSWWTPSKRAASAIEMRSGMGEVAVCRGTGLSPLGHSEPAPTPRHLSRLLETSWPTPFQDPARMAARVQQPGLTRGRR